MEHSIGSMDLSCRECLGDLFGHLIHRDAAARQTDGATEIRAAHEIRSETSRSPQAWCHVIANFAESLLILMVCKTQMFNSCHSFTALKRRLDSRFVPWQSVAHGASDISEPTSGKRRHSLL